MTQSISYSELVNLAIGTPELGIVNFNALHLVLHGILDCLHLKDVKKKVTEDEMDFIKPASALRTASVTTSSEALPVAKKPSSLFHQMQERIAALEKQLSFLNDAPDTEELLARSQGSIRPVQDMWQMMQLRKKTELNEEAMTKAMNTLQDLLSNIFSLKTSISKVEEELGQLNLDMSEMKEQLQQLDQKTDMLETGEVKGSDASDVVRWSSLCETLTGKSFSETEKEGREKTSREVLAVLGHLPEKHEALSTKMAELEAQLKKQVGLAEALPELNSLMEQMEKIQSHDVQRKASLEGTMDQVQRLKEQCEKMQSGMDQVFKNASEMEAIRSMLEQLDINKADKVLIEEEMKVKADKSALEAKVNHMELQSATTQLTEMMQDLLQKMSLQDKDWQKALEKLFTDMDCKLDRMALDPVSQQLEEVWKFIKKYLSEGPHFDADSAAGFKKQLFERVKCISCDRPVTMATGPHMITVRKAPTKPRPATANGYEYLARPQRKDLEALEPVGTPPVQTCWQCQAHHQSCSLKRLSRTQDLATVYPYGDPTVLTYDNTEVDILGVNGVLYKGRLGAQARERALALQKEFAAVKPPRPPSRTERARSAFADVSVSPYAASTLRRIGPVPSGSSRRGEFPTPPQTPQTTLESVDGAVISVGPNLSQDHFQNGGGMVGI